jgi:hypothetical protein
MRKRVIYFRRDVWDGDYQAALEQLFDGSEHPTIDLNGERFKRIDNIARILGVGDFSKVFDFGSEPERRFQDSDGYNKYKMARVA